MASLWRRAMVYLGLVDDDEYDYEYEYDYGESPRAPAPQTAAPGPAESSAVRTLGPEGAGSLPAPQRPTVVRPSNQVAPKVHVIEPRSFNDAQEVGERLRITQPVILNLQGIDRELQRRFIDFSSGVTFALNGSMTRVHDEVFLLTPVNVEVSDEEKERLQARGLYGKQQ